MTANSLLSSTAPYTQVGTAGGSSYSFAANTTYTGVFSLTRTGADTLDLSGSLFQGVSLLSTWTVSDPSGIVSTIGALGFHVNANMFGSSSTVGAPDNGIDFSNITIEYVAVPEPSTWAMLGLGCLMFVLAQRRR